MQLEVASESFSEDAFEKVVRQACRIPEREPVPCQVRYLLTYLRHAEAAARTMVVETPYIDRHFITEYQGYYATSLRGVPRFTTRLHLFSEAISVSELLAQLAEANADGRRDLQTKLQASYLGFIVLRPLSGAPIGRTVLRWYGGHDARRFGPRPPPHRVHLLGLRLKAFGVQFHQQDQAVGACATAAIWCALAAVMRRDGGRSPTPLAVTEAATRSVPTSRALPAVSGLTLEQMVGAINASGYSPDVIKPAGAPAFFQLQLMTYVRSGIPVVLQVQEEDAVVGHAVTLVGFRVADDSDDAKPIEYPFKNSYTLRAKAMTRLYVHDDRIGPYARMVWIHADPEESENDALDDLEDRVAALEAKVWPEAEPAESDTAAEASEPTELEGWTEFPSIRLQPNDIEFDSFSRKLSIYTAIAPLYPKIRISALDLLSVAMEVWPMAAFLAGARRDELLLESFFSLGGSYLETIFDRGMPGERAARIASTLLLSRYVGVVRFMTGQQWALDVICDATDIHRESPAWSSVLAVIPATDDAQVESLRSLAGKQFPHVVVT